MRFLHIKNEQICWYCRSTLFPGEEAIVVRIKHRNEMVIPQFFHIDCFRNWTDESIVNRLLHWRETATRRPKRKYRHRPKMGRPRKYRNSLQAHRLLSSLSYHRKAGNMDKVKELEDSLEQNLLSLDK